jgi:hypothetical protein
MSEGWTGENGGGEPTQERSAKPRHPVRPHPWWIIPDDEPEERGRLLHRAHRAGQRDAEVMGILEARYKVTCWGRNGKIILI